MIILDTSVLIGYLDRDDRHHSSATNLLAAEVDDDFAANPLTFAEVFVAPAREGRLEDVQAALQDLEVQELPFPADTAVRLARLRSETGLKMPDCCVLLAAETANARLASFDDQLTRIARSRNLVTIGV